MEEEKQFPTLNAIGVSKPYWYLIKFTSEISFGEDDTGFFKSSKSYISVIEFNDLEEAGRYFETLNAQFSENFNAEILKDYTYDLKSQK